ncbi:MAG TPA: hypothetical protein VHW72_17140 [Candidatus Angelobacter sp.]|nr:hypothetical protein [Candidatus Angelobacter sp.]
MKSSLDELVLVIDRLISRLDELESRVAALERPAASHKVTAAQPAATVTKPAAIATQQAHPLAQLSRSSNPMPVIGKVFLGVAGAYLLRALAESGSLPMWAVAGAAMLYAGAWLLAAARTVSPPIFAGASYAATAAVILPPMLWELTLRFKVMPAWAAATALLLFAALAAALAWKQKLASVVVLPVAFSAVAAVALLVGTHDPFPFVTALLLMALIAEVAASTDRWPGLRPLVAIPLDLAVLALVLIYTGSNGVSPDYQPLAEAGLLKLFVALPVIYGVSVLSRTLVLRRQISVFETGQMTAALLLSGFGILRTTHNYGAIALGMFCLAAAAGCYWLSHSRFESPAFQRSYHVFSTWAIALALAGSLLCLPATPDVFFLGAAAIAATFIGVRSGRISLAFHGAAYLAAVAVISGALQYGFELSIGKPPQAGGWLLWTAFALTIISYALVWHSADAQEQQWPHSVLRLALAALATFAVLATVLTAFHIAFPAATAALLAAGRTLVICLLAVLLGWSGSRFRRAELLWLAYAAIVLCTLKLMLEDLRSGSAVAIAFSFFCYGMVWVLVPRFAKSSRG